MQPLDEKLNQLFPGKVVLKDLTAQLKGNAVVPSYVLEYLLGQYCATDDEETIKQGLDTVRDILLKHFIHRDESELIKATIREKGVYKVIDKIGVTLNEKKDFYEAAFSNLGIRQVLIEDGIVKKHRKLLTGGVWCIVDVRYEHSDETKGFPWVVERLKPIQISSVDLDEYKQLRAGFTTDEWLDVMLQSLGLNPEHFTKRAKLNQLARLIPFCENNYNLIELGPKGTGKSHVFSEFSPHGILISGGDVTQAKLFVNNASGKIGLVGFWDTVAFDEFAGKDKRVDKKLVDIMKNFMANKSFSRGRDVYGATASMAFVGNTDHSVPYMLRHSHLFVSLPNGYLDSAFLDRIHCYLPGWEVDKLRNEMFTNGYGFIVDYLAEVLKGLRKEDYSHLLKAGFQLSDTLTSRDRDGVTKTFSGLMKLVFPHGVFEEKESREILEFALEGRKRVKNQLYKIDDTFEEVKFSFTDTFSGITKEVLTLEEERFQAKVQQHKEVLGKLSFDSFTDTSRDTESDTKTDSESAAPPPSLKSRTISIRDGMTGISYENLFGDYLEGASVVLITDPYIRQRYQIINVLDLIRVIIGRKQEGEEVAVHLTTSYDYGNKEGLRAQLLSLGENVLQAGIQFSFEFEEGQNFHARSIQTSSGWKISLERGLDFFQAPDRENPFGLEWTMQEYRKVKETTITFLKSADEEIVE